MSASFASAFYKFQYEPVITPGNELNFHHVILYRCKGINSSYDGVAGNCYERDRPLPQCVDIIIAWAVGGEVDQNFQNLTESDCRNRWRGRLNNASKKL